VASTPAHSEPAALPLAAALSSSDWLVSRLHSWSVFLGAFLLFLVEPLIAKAILPWFGGSAAVWATCLVFFQTALLLGYLYADVVSRRLPPRQVVVVHIALLLLSLLFLPLAPRASWRPHPGDDPVWRILGLLATSIGLPFLLLSATSPLVQIWYARRRSSQPYHLFALSNFASLAALLSYPLLFEPRFTLHTQLRFWSILFVLFAAVCSFSAWCSRGGAASQPAASEARTAAPATRTWLLWLGLSACGSMLLLSITNYILLNVAPVPLLWVLPLALYLLTFTLAFSRRKLYSRWLMVRLLAVALGSLGYAIYDSQYTNSIQVSVPLFGIGLFLCCFFCHGELYRLRPDPSRLTSFYLVISLGGASGAILIGLVAPHLFTNVYELPATLLLTALLALAVLWPACAGRSEGGPGAMGWFVRAFWSATAVAMAVVFVLNVRSYERNTVVKMRSFYGALRVRSRIEGDNQPIRALLHGTIRHGAQFQDPSLRRQPTTYYGPDSGVGLALRFCCEGPRRVGVIGLGAGTLATYGKTGDSFRFYEINPQVIQLARSSFTFLSDSPARIEIVLGDARLSLEREPPQQFDVLAVDAFSGDAIPVHLLTREAVALFLRHLKPEGILAIHTSNTYLELAPVVKQLADAAGYPSRLIASEEDDDNLISNADWVLVTRNEAFLARAELHQDEETVTIPPGLRPWTDDYNNLFRILKRPKIFEADSD
jgi:SAM-dependent methyltransferase